MLMLKHLLTRSLIQPGAGKTTAAAKLANWATKQSYAKKILMIAADVYRPAAIDQLKLLGQRLNVDVYSEDIRYSLTH